MCERLRRRQARSLPSPWSRLCCASLPGCDDKHSVERCTEARVNTCSNCRPVQDGALTASPIGNQRRHGVIVDLLLSQTVALGASVIVTFVTAKLLGPGGRGQMAFIITTANLLGILAFGSLHVGVTDAHKSGDPTALRRGLTVGLWGAACILFVTLGAALGARLCNNSPLANQLLLTSVGASLVCFNLVVLRTRQGLGDARAFRNAWSIQSGIYLVFGVLFAAITHLVTPVVCSWFVGLVVSTIYALHGYRRPAECDHAVIVSTRSIVLTSFSAHIGFIGIQVLYRADIIVLGLVVSSEQLGIYSVAAPIAELTWVLSEALSLVAFSQVRRDQSLERRLAERGRLLRINLIAATVGALIIAVATWVFLPKVLPAYSRAVSVVLILLPGILIQGAARISFSALVATGVRRPPIIIGTISAVLAVLYLPFSLLWGITGAAIAATTIYGLQALLVFSLVHRLDHARAANAN